MSIENMPAVPAVWSDSVNVSTKKLGRFALLSIGGFLALFVAWAVAVPISGAAISTGKLVVDGQNKLIQHAEGGRIEKIFVHDGDVLKVGDPIFALESEVQEGDVVIYLSRWVLKQAAAKRLTALLDRKDSVDFGSIISNIDLNGRLTSFIAEHKLGPEFSTFMAQQMQNFDDARNRLNEDQTDLGSRKAEATERMVGAKRKIEILKTEASRLAKQIARVEPLVSKGFVARSRLDELLSRSSELKSQVAAAETESVGAGEQVKSIAAQTMQVESLSRDTWGKELTATQTEINDAYSQLLSALDKREKRVVRAPIAGTLVKTVLHTEGGVIRASETVGEIVPSGTQMIAEVRIRPEDITSVNLDQKVSLIVAALNRHLSDPIDATVSYVSSDTTLDEKTQVPYYVARLQLNKESVEKAVSASDTKLTAGMEVQAYIRLPDRNFVSYVMKPVSDSFRHAFRER